jgi:hypothetical protein
MKSVLTFLTVFLSFFAHGQEMSKEEALLYFLKTSGRKPVDQMTESHTKKWLQEYLETLRAYDWQQARNDEFQRQRLANEVNNYLLDKMSSLDYSKKFTIVSKVMIGEYSFEKSSFPFSIQDWYPEIYSGEENFTLVDPFRVNIGYIINSSDLMKELKMISDRASSFLSSRKDAHGNVDRTVYLKFYYSIVNQPFKNRYASSVAGKDLGIYVYSIQIFSSPGGSGEKLGEILPSVDWYDKINGVRVANSQSVESPATNATVSSKGSQTQSEKLIASDYKSTIIGKWKYHGVGKSEFLTLFNNDGTYSITGMQSNKVLQTGTWSIDGTNLILVDPKETTVNSIKVFEREMFVINTKKGDITFVRINN